MSKSIKSKVSVLLALFIALAAVFTIMPVEVEAMTGDIHVYTRDASSGTREAFEEKAGYKGELTDLAVEVASNGDMAVKVGQDPQAIGYVSLTTDFEANNIKPVQYAGVDATEANVLSGDYKLARPFSYVTRAAGDFESQEKEDLIKAFVAFLLESDEGLGAVEAAGGIVDYSNARPWSEIAAEHPIVDQDNSGIELITTGSTSVVKTLDSAKEVFSPLAGGVTFKSEHPGSGEGWKRTLGDEKDSANRA
ncbi:MAG TPA: hypothetical protein GXZ89_04570, partial [Fastidiosipila sp.]|nr:hypothetical protein [Fastidiosipila sp.]